MNWPQNLLLRLCNVDTSKSVTPSDSLQVGDVLVGTVADNELIKRLFHLLYECIEKADSLEFAYDIIWPPSSASQTIHDELRIKYMLTLQESIAIWTIIRQLIRQKFPKQLADKENIFLRENWQVVYVETNLPAPALKDINIATPLFGPGV